MDFSFHPFMMKVEKVRRNFMKVLMINGSCHEKGCTYTALNEIAKVLKEEDIESEIVFWGTSPSGIAQDVEDAETITDASLPMIW